MSNRPWTSETPKATPVSGDRFLILDSEDSNVNKLITVGSLPTEFTGAWTAAHNANGQTLDNVGILASNATNPATDGAIRLGNGETIQWRFADNSSNATLSLDSNNEFSINRALNMNANAIKGVSYLVESGTDVPDAGVIRLENASTITWRSTGTTGYHEIMFENNAFQLEFASGDEYTFTTVMANWGNKGLINIQRTNFNQTTLTYNATQTFDFNANQYRQITLAGDLTSLTTSNQGAGKVMSIIVIGDTVDRNITFNTAWHHNPSDPSIVISAGARVIMSFYCAGGAESDVIVAVSQFE